MRINFHPIKTFRRKRLICGFFHLTTSQVKNSYTIRFHVKYRGISPETEVLIIPILDLNNTNVDMMTIAIRMNGVMIIQIPTLVFTIGENGKMIRIFWKIKSIIWNGEKNSSQHWTFNYTALNSNFLKDFFNPSNERNKFEKTQKYI